MKRIIIYLVLLLLAVPAANAAPVSFTANAETDGGRVVLTLEVSGAKPEEEPLLPRLDGFRVLSAKKMSKNVFENGVFKSTYEYMYTLLPTKSGVLTIPSATVEIGGKTYRTDPIKLEVKGDGGYLQKDGLKPLFVTLTADRTTAYLDEQIILTFRFYEAGRQARDLQLQSPPSKGFRVEALGDPGGENGTERIDGKVYNTKSLRYALFPYKTGELKVGPIRFSCTVPGPRQGRRSRSFFDDPFFSDSFFFSSPRTPVNLTTQEMVIRVLPLPEEGRPADKKISVGRYSMEVSVKPGKTKVGDPITVKTVIEGSGNLDTVSAPVIETDSDFKTYEPSSKTEITDRTTEIRGRKIFEEILVPLNEDIKEIPDIKFTYFDTATKKYRTISKGPISIEVLPAPEEGPLQIVELRPHETGESVQLIKKDIHFIKLSPGRFTQRGRTILSRPAFILINVIPAACFVFVFLATRKREKMRSDFAYARLSRSYKKAVSGARKSAALIGKRAPKEFYSAAEGVLSRYVGDRLNVPGASVLRDNVMEYMRSLGLGGETLSRAEKFYRDCELAQFASQDCKPSDMKKTLEDLNEIIQKIEKKK